MTTIISLSYNTNNCIVLIPKITESTKTRQNAVFISSTRLARFFLHLLNFKYSNYKGVIV